MEELEAIDWEALSRMEQSSLIESILSLDCMRDKGIQEAIIQHDEIEEDCKVYEYEDEDVFSKYLEFKEQMGTPVNLTEFLSEKRESEYEDQSGQDWMSYWEKYDESVSGHALALLKEYESKHRVQ